MQRDLQFYENKNPGPIETVGILEAKQQGSERVGTVPKTLNKSPPPPTFWMLPRKSVVFSL